MGSVLSGRYGRRSSRATVHDCLALDVRFLGRKSLLAAGSCFLLSWTQQGQTVDSLSATVEEKRLIIAGAYGCDAVSLDSTAAGFGGRRAWFRCPRCGRRCAPPYRAGGFACRVCLHLAYPVQREGRYDRTVAAVCAVDERATRPKRGRGRPKRGPVT